MHCSLNIRRYWAKLRILTNPIYIYIPFGVTSLEFFKYLWCWSHLVLYDVVCVILLLAFLIELQLVMDRLTEPQHTLC